jgi:Cdc6-like AAA superfamily ATPase
VNKPTITTVENAFLPSKEITDSERFSGRETAVSDAYYALIAEGSNIAIVGNRGIGKTSLARQIANIGSGDSSILKKLGVPYDNELDFLTVYLACGNQIQTTDELLERLLTSTNCLAEWIYDIPKAKKVVMNHSAKLSAKLFGVGMEAGGSQATEATTSPIISEHPIDVVFTNVVDAISQEGIAKNGILFIIDEFDQISNPSGFASFLKALATNSPNVKFCIVGVAKDIQMLMKEHESSDRLFAGSIIPMEPMTSDELNGIIDNAESFIDHYIKFDDSSRTKIIQLANGHPYMVHLIGKFALRTSYQNGQQTITSTEINNTLASIAERKADPVLEGKYRKAVASSLQREVVLKAMASVQDDHNEIWTTNAYKIALDNDVDNASQYVGQLVSEEYGAEIEKIRERFYRFKDSLFHAYVLARPNMYK